MAEEIDYKVKVDTTEVDQAESSFSKFTNKAKQAASGLTSKLSDMSDKFGELPGSLGRTASAFTGVGKSMMALVANPLGAILAALVGIFAGLRAALTKSEEGMDALARVTSIFGAILNPIIQAVSGFATLLVDGLANGLELVAGLFGTAATEGRKLADMQDELEDRELALNEARAKGNKELAQARELLSDSNASLADRQKALEQVRKSETDLAANELKFAQDRLAAARLDQKLNGQTEESKKAISDAVVATQNAETELAAKRRLFNREAKKLDREEEERKKEMAKAEADRQKELVEKQKEYASQRREASDKIREADRKNIIDSIQDEEEKAKKQAEFDLDNAKREIARGKYTKAEKDRLIQEAEEANQIKLGQIASDAEKKKLDDKKKADEELKAFMEKSAEDEAKFIDDQYAKEQLRLTQTLTNEKDLQDALTNLELERLQNQIQARKDAGQSTTELEQQLANKRIDIAKDEEAKKKDLAQKEFDTKMAIFDATSNALSALGNAVGEETATAKTLAVAGAIIDTYAGATKALAAGAGTPVGYINAAAIIAAGFANVRKMTATPVPGSSDTASATPSGPSVSIVGGSADPSAQIARSLAQQNQKPIKAYAVATDMSTQQALDRRIQQNATFPG
jgi:chemotaxis protein histidine kinase CheA